MAAHRWKVKELKIAHKISAAIFVFILCPAVILPSLLFMDMREQEVRDCMKKLELDLEQSRIWIREDLDAGLSEEEIINELLSDQGGVFVFYLDKDGIPYYPRTTGVRPYHLGEILEALDAVLWEPQCIQTELSGIPVIIGVLAEGGLEGVLIQVESLQRMQQRFEEQNNRYIIWMIIFAAAGFIMIDLVVHRILRRFYHIVETVHELQKGNLDAEVPDCGTDEIGELAEQMKLMGLKIKELMRENLNRQLLVKNSEIRILQNQINAHFIYNVLESVKMMAETDENYQLSDAVTSLGQMLRYSMKGLAKNVTLEEEIKYIRNYIALMNLRFDYEIYLSIRIPEELWAQEIPKMSLQPIVENAIHHGIEQLAVNTVISIKGIRKETHYFIEISDPGKGMDGKTIYRLQKELDSKLESSAGEKDHGIGLKNVQDRIRMCFGDEFGLKIDSKLGCFTKISVKMPYTKKEV